LPTLFVAGEFLIFTPKITVRRSSQDQKKASVKLKNSSKKTSILVAFVREKWLFYAFIYFCAKTAAAIIWPPERTYN
jgi:hypothetical protein